MATKTTSKLKSKPVAGRRKTSASAKPQQRPLEWVDDFVANLPPEAWDNVPTDGARNLDHYLYGAPKRKK